MEKCQLFFKLEFRRKRRSTAGNVAPLALTYPVLRDQSENLIKGLKTHLYILEDRVYFAMTIKISSFLTQEQISSFSICMFCLYTSEALIYVNNKISYQKEKSPSIIDIIS